jgi:hypothetical protein
LYNNPSTNKVTLKGHEIDYGRSEEFEDGKTYYYLVRVFNINDDTNKKPLASEYLVINQNSKYYELRDNIINKLDQTYYSEIYDFFSKVGNYITNNKKIIIIIIFLL